MGRDRVKGVHMHQVIVNTNTYHGYSLDEAIEEISKLGFKEVELTATIGWTEHVYPTFEFKELLRLKNKLKDYQLEVVGMSGHSNLMDSDRLNDFKNNIHLAKFFNAKYIVSSIGEAHIEDKEHKTEDELVENIKSLVPTLEETGLMLVLEVHGDDHGTGQIIQQIVEKVDSDKVKIAYDTANAIFYGDVDIFEDIENTIDDIAYIHLKDKSGEKREWNFPAIGKGDIDFERLFKLLDKYNKHLPISIEIEFTSEGPKDIEEINQALKDSKEELERLNIL